jgi:hypothetical protein
MSFVADELPLVDPDLEETSLLSANRSLGLLVRPKGGSAPEIWLSMAGLLV